MKWFKSHSGLLATVELVIIIGLATSTVLLATSKSNKASSQNHVSSQQQVASTTPAQTATSSNKLGSCKSGTTLSIGNAGYLVGTDISPGNYAVQDTIPASNDNAAFTVIAIYNSKADYDKGYANPNDDNPTQAFQANPGSPTNTKLSDGQYMSVSGDPATYTCQ